VVQSVTFACHHIVHKILVDYMYGMENVSKKASYTIFSIFMMLTLLCGTVMLVINLYNGNYFEPIVHTMAVFMIIGSIIAFVSATIIRVRRKMVNKD